MVIRKFAPTEHTSVFNLSF